MANNDQTCIEVQQSLCSESYKKLIKAVEKSVKRITSKNRIKPYLELCFADVLKRDRKICVRLFEDMLNELETIMKEEIELQLSMNNVENLLTVVDVLKLEYGHSSERKWRPSGNPKEDLKAHFVDVHQMELNKLEKILTTLESQNKLLKECVMKTDDRLQQSLTMVQECCSSWGEGNLIPSTGITLGTQHIN
ncbi:hypothetical protein Btru_048926 [Bulinus truncatus]|nr:hypothetical protein Btru_048926 [Bulinus truncatus]